MARRLFGRIPRPWEFAGLTGAPDDAKVQVGTSQGTLWIEMQATTPNGYHGVYQVLRTRRELTVVNEAFRIHERTMQRKGLGLDVFRRQLHYADVLGIRRITTHAGRRRGENGYYTWPRFGFDGRLPRRIRGSLPSTLQDATSILDLMACAAGRHWWKRHGTTIHVAFDLRARSRSWNAFYRYLDERLGGS